jgi:hypothetical protein
MLTIEFSKMYYTRWTVPILSLEQYVPVLETVRNLFLINKFLNCTVTDTMTTQNIDLSSWDNLYIILELQLPASIGQSNIH